MNVLRLPNFSFVGRGRKITAGADTGREATVVGVIEKLPLSLLEPSEVIPPTLNGLPTDVREAGRIEFLRTGKYRPAPGGVSIGHYAVTAGTLGMVVRDKIGHRLILSNAHVLANTNEGKVDDPVYQPGPHDGGTEGSVIAHLDKSIPIRFAGESDCWIAGQIARILNLFASGRSTRMVPMSTPLNRVDAALAMPLSEDCVTDYILEVGVPTGWSEVDVGDRVKKSGRTTGLTHGIVEVVEAVTKVGFRGKEAWFDDQIITSNMGSPGDSGSVGFTLDDTVFGLLFAGSSQVTIYNRIKNVREALGL